MNKKEILKEIQKECYEISASKGWHDDPAWLENVLNNPSITDQEKEEIKKLCRNKDTERIALIHSEVSEALESMRHGYSPDDKIPEYNGVEAELADAIIRIFDMAEAHNLKVIEAMFAKMEYNKTRPYKHGGKKF